MLALFGKRVCTPHGLRPLGSELYKHSLLYPGAQGNRLLAREANASGERASTWWGALLIGHVLSVKEEPPWLLAMGSVRSFKTPAFKNKTV